MPQRDMSNELYVRHVPGFLSRDALSEFFQHYGASNTNAVTTNQLQRSKSKHSSVIVTFPSHDVAMRALNRLRGVKLLGSTLHVEFANHTRHTEAAPGIQPRIHNATFVSNSNVTNTMDVYPQRERHATIAANLGIDWPSPPWLQYQYPPASRTTLDNISSALYHVPVFYEQVLHLMNKMNLPPPFDEYPTFSDTAQPQQHRHPSATQNTAQPMDVDVMRVKPARKRLDEANETNTIEEVEEEESGDGDVEMTEASSLQTTTAQLDTFVSIPPAKRPKTSEREAVEIQHQNDQPHRGAMREITVQLAQKTASTTTIPMEEVVDTVTADSPARQQVEQRKPFLSDHELHSNKATLQQIQDIPRFAQHQFGEPSPKLFVKNLIKGVKLEELHYVFGRYFESDEQMSRELEIKVLAGRLAGSAIISMPTSDLAQRALHELHGFLLHDKPMIIEFGKR